MQAVLQSQNIHADQINSGETTIQRTAALNRLRYPDAQVISRASENEQLSPLHSAIDYFRRAFESNALALGSDGNRLAFIAAKIATAGEWLEQTPAINIGGELFERQLRLMPFAISAVTHGIKQIVRSARESEQLDLNGAGNIACWKLARCCVLALQSAELLNDGRRLAASDLSQATSSFNKFSVQRLKLAASLIETAQFVQRVAHWEE